MPIHPSSHQAQPTLRRSHPLWLHVTVSGHFSADQVLDWHRRLQAHLNSLGLTAAISPRRLAIWRTGADLGPFDRGLVMGWLIAQPEVVLVRIERHAKSDAVANDSIDTLHSQEEHHE